MRQRAPGVPGNSLKGSTLTYLDSLGLSISTGTVAQKVPGTYREELNCLVSGEGLEGQLSPRQDVTEAIILLLSPLPTELAGGCCI